MPPVVLGFNNEARNASANQIPGKSDNSRLLYGDLTISMLGADSCRWGRPSICERSCILPLCYFLPDL